MDKRRHPFPLILDSRARATSTRVNEIKREGGGGGEERERERERRLSFCISTLVRWKFRYGGDFLRGMASPVPALNLIGCRVISRCVTSGWLVAAVVMTTPHHHHHRGRHPRINRPPRPRTPALLCRVLVTRVCVQYLCLSVFTFSSLPLAFVSIFPLFFSFSFLSFVCFQVFFFLLFPFFLLGVQAEGRHLVFGLNSEKSLREKEIVSRNFVFESKQKLGENSFESWNGTFLNVRERDFFLIFAISKDIHRHVKVYLHWNMNIHINI